MAVKCPKHKVDLSIEYTSINMMGSKYPVVTGECPKCKVKYLSREIMSSSGSFKIGGQAYEYLNEMEIAYPHPFKPIDTASQVKTSSTNSPDPKTNSPSSKGEPTAHSKKQQRIDAQNRRQKELAEKRKQEEAKAAKKAEDAHKCQMDAREAAILEVRQRNAQGLNKSYRVRKLNYLDKIPSKCPNDGEQLDYVKNIQIELSGTSVKRSSWCCFRCRTAFFLDSEREEITAKINRAELKELQKSKTPVLVIQKTTEEKSNAVNLATPQNTLYVCKGLIACKRNGHAVESATGLLISKNETIVKINTNYCPKCRKYFIGHDEYMRYRKLYGILLGNIKLTNGSFGGYEADLAEESILHMCGYSVNQTDNLSPALRQGILQYLIDSKVSNKPEIIDYLNFFIRRNGKKQNMGEAVRRWNEDLKWVREYQINRQRHFEITNIQKYT